MILERYRRSSRKKALSLASPHATAADRIAETFHLSHRASWNELVELAQNYAEVRLKRLPPGLDGLACKFPADGGTPVVWVDSTLPENRRRFTLVHELGHVVLGWHGHAFNSCQIEFALNLDREPFSDRGLEEAEANEFAGRLLVPTHFLRRLQQRFGPPDVIRRAHRASASSTAICIRLLSFLDVGWSFVQVDRYGKVAYRGAVEGTVTNLPHPTAVFDAAAMGRLADEVVHIDVGGPLDTWWYWHDDDVDLSAAPDRPSKEILNEILLDVCDEHAIATMRQRINGIVGALNSRLHSPAMQTSAEELYALLRQRFENRPRLLQILNHPLWDSYLRARAIELAAN